MCEQCDILLPYLQCESENRWRQTPYALDDQSLNELHRRSHEKIETLFPDWPPYPTVQRINRELEALWTSPYAHALLVADDAMKVLEKKGILVTLRGLWCQSYYVYLMGMTDQEPLGMPDPSVLVGGPILLQVAAKDEGACREALLLAAWEHGFSLGAEGDNGLILLPPERSCVQWDCFAFGKMGDAQPTNAPVVRLLI